MTDATTALHGAVEARLSDIARLRCSTTATGWKHRFLHDAEAATLLRDTCALVTTEDMERLVAFYELAVLRSSREHKTPRDALLLEMWRFEAMLYHPTFRPVAATRLSPLAKPLDVGDVVRVQFAFAVGGRAVDEVALQLESKKGDLWVGRVLTEPEALAGLLSQGDMTAFPESAVSEVAVVDARTRGFLAALRSS